MGKETIASELFEAIVRGDKSHANIYCDAGVSGRLLDGPHFVVGHMVRPFARPARALLMEVPYSDGNLQRLISNETMFRMKGFRLIAWEGWSHGGLTYVSGPYITAFGAAADMVDVARRVFDCGADSIRLELV